MTKRSDGVRAGGRGVGGSVAIALLIACPAVAQTGQAPPATPARVISDTGRLHGPRQPIFFRHDVHAGQDRIPCLYCHSTVTISSEPGIPALQTCFGCHQIIGGSTPSHKAEIQKVREAWINKRPPEWTRVHALPGFVRFPHQRHIKVLGTESCSTCHGDVRGMPQVYQVQTLKMGWCVNCHLEHKVSRDCTVCHY
jgi:Cytochrome c7 and related cytochrome c